MSILLVNSLLIGNNNIALSKVNENRAIYLEIIEQ
jgi:hypothetical protein